MMDLKYKVKERKRATVLAECLQDQQYYEL